MKTFGVILLSLFVVLTACNKEVEQSNTKIADSKTTEQDDGSGINRDTRVKPQDLEKIKRDYARQNQEITEVESTVNPKDKQGTTEVKGSKTLGGILYSATGNKPVISGHVISDPAFFEKGKKWKEEYVAFKSQKVTLVGEVSYYYCKEGEACSADGIIKYVTKVKSIKRR